jgi:hypothetical protein
MKNILLLTVLLIPSLVFANGRIQIKPANELWCSLALQNQVVLVKDLSPTLQIHQTILTNALDKWLIEFDIGNDPVVGDATQSLCLGFYNEESGPNAIAYGQTGILFGTALLAHLSETNSPENYWNNLKYILAHEFAHYLQNRFQLKFNYTLPMLSVKVKELHADCIAGYLVRMHKEALGDSQVAMAGFVASLGDSHAVGDHGLADDRMKAFDGGLRSSARDIILGKKPHQVSTSDIISHCSQFYAPTK